MMEKASGGHMTRCGSEQVTIGAGIGTMMDNKRVTIKRVTISAGIGTMIDNKWVLKAFISTTHIPKCLLQANLKRVCGLCTALRKAAAEHKTSRRQSTAALQNLPTVLATSKGQNVENTRGGGA